VLSPRARALTPQHHRNCRVDSATQVCRAMMLGGARRRPDSLPRGGCCGRLSARSVHLQRWRVGCLPTRRRKDRGVRQRRGRGLQWLRPRLLRERYAALRATLHASCAVG
jgi:hypothetical protein